MLLDRPVVVTGTPCSGKSMICKIISQSPEFHWLSEPITIWNAGLDSKPDDRRTAAEATTNISNQIAVACQAQVQKAGKRRYLDDLSYHALRIPFLVAVMPNVRVIHVIRNGVEAIPEMYFGWTYRDTVARAVMRRARSISLRGLPKMLLRFCRNYVRSRVRGKRATWGPCIPGLNELVATRDAAEIAAIQWRDIIEIATADLSQLPNDQVLEVRHDRVLNDPPAELKKIADFCQTEQPESLTDYAQEFLVPDFEVWNRREPDPAQWQAIRTIIDPLQQKLSYSA